MNPQLKQRLTAVWDTPGKKPRLIWAGVVAFFVSFLLVWGHFDSRQLGEAIAGIGQPAGIALAAGAVLLLLYMVLPMHRHRPGEEAE